MDGIRSYVFRVFLLFFSIMVAVSLLLQIVMYTITGATVREQLGNKCLGIAVSVATLLEQNTDSLKEYLRTMDTSSEYYIRTKANLEKIHSGNADNIAFLYIERRVSATEIMYVLDGALPGSPDFSPPGTLEDITINRKTAYDTESIYVGRFVTNPWGHILSAYAPIFDQRTGELLALAGVDVSFQQYRNIMRNQFSVILVNTVIFALLAILLLLMTSNSIEKRFFTDSLTGIYNRGFFTNFLKTQLKAIKRKDFPVMVFMADVDHFKNINDTYGHPFGDKVLTNISGIMNSFMKKTDCLARYGGEEFAAIMPGVNLEQARNIVKQIHEAVGNSVTKDETDGISAQVTISIGVVRLDRNASTDDAIKHADIALYEAKKTRNAVVFYDSSMG
ncbi:MAG: GGDEF domain-containing protein [Spirochaetaceae bacterium]|jgi:diguanylate cyclase (GGDEF)-like protein|nr:GGDEF domain-containing protein [Spirochaetaceae bacterium]